MHHAMVCFVLRVEAEDIGIVLHDKKKRAVIFIALAHIAPANRSSKFKELYIRGNVAKCVERGVNMTQPFYF